MLREGILGTIVGIMPGAGATIASFLAYSTEVKISKTPEKFGTGIPEGIVASETANNAAAAGMMIPLLAMGIPGGTGAAMMMVALTMQGVQCGPLLLKSQPFYLYAVVMGMLFASIAMVIISLIIAKVFARMFCMPYRYLGAIIFILACVGCYAKNGRMDDVYMMIIAGAVGFFLKRFSFNVSAMTLGLVLGILFEKNLRRTITLSQGDIFGYIWSKPITVILILFVLAIFALSAFNSYRKKTKKTARLAEDDC